jgi:signal transduction histidine kinase
VANDAREFLGTAGLPLDLDLPTPTPELPVPSTTRHALASALRESLHNVVRHAQASNVSIRIQVASGQLEMEVRDNGRGFVVPAHPMEKASSGTTGRGVRNLYARMQELGGSCRIDSSPGQGTSVRLSVPLSQQSR